jgi:isoleucyl-tRNA synthetase
MPTTSEKPEKSEAAKREEETLAFWKEHDVFQKSLEKAAPKGDFIFYEGPPTANGRPGVHHLETRAFKDAIQCADITCLVALVGTLTDCRWRLK